MAQFAILLINDLKCQQREEKGASINGFEVVSVVESESFLLRKQYAIGESFS